MEMRKKKLVRNDIQLRLCLTFTLLTSVGLLLQFLAFLATMTGKGLNEAGLGEAHAEIVDATWMALVLSALVVLPLTAAISILATHRFAGPLFVFRGFLEALVRGERPEDIRLRKDDELKDLSELLNRATQSLRQPDSEGDATEARSAA